MIIYPATIMLILVFMCRIPGFSERTKCKLLLFYLFMIALFRDVSIGNDTANYVSLFERGGFEDIYGYGSRFEKGYLLLNAIIRSLSSNHLALFIVVEGFIFFTFYVYITHHTQDPVFSVLMFFCLGTFGQTLNAMRLMIALCICLWTKMLPNKKKNRLVTIILIIIASFFQRIALVYLLVLLIPKKTSKRYELMCITFGFAGVAMAPALLKLVGGLFPYFAHYLNNSIYSSEGIQLASVIIFLMQTIVFVFCGRTIKLSKNDISDTSFQELSSETNKILLASMITLVSFRFNLLDRCSYLFWVSSIVLLPESLSLYRKHIGIKNRNYCMLKLFSIVIAISYFFIITIYKREWNSIYPYKSIFNVFWS